jgi:hypothetical protein
MGCGTPPGGGAASGTGPLAPELDGGGVIECCGAEDVVPGTYVLRADDEYVISDVPPRAGVCRGAGVRRFATCRWARRTGAFCVAPKVSPARRGCVDSSITRTVEAARDPAGDGLAVGSDAPERPSTTAPPPAKRPIAASAPAAAHVSFRLRAGGSGFALGTRPGRG